MLAAGQVDALQEVARALVDLSFLTALDGTDCFSAKVRTKGTVPNFGRVAETLDEQGLGIQER